MGRQNRRRTGTGNERRNRPDVVESRQLHESERERQTRTEGRLVFHDTGESPHSATGTTNDVGNSDASIIDLVVEKELTRKRRFAEEEILLDDDIRQGKPMGRRGSRA